MIFKSILFKYIAKISKGYGEERKKSLINMAKEIGGVNTFVDAGCSDGEVTEAIINKINADRVIGLDIDKSALSKARKRGIDAKKCDLNQKIPLKSDSIDLIVSIETIEHLIDVDRFIDEVKRVLKTGGYFIVTTENLASFHNIIVLLFGIQPYTGPYISRKVTLGHRPFGCFWKEEKRKNMPPHLNVMTTKTLKDLLEKNGFLLKNIKAVGLYPFSLAVSSILTKIFRNHSAYVVVSAQLLTK